MYFCRMNFANLFWLLLSAACLNTLVYLFFKTYLVKGNAPAMKFLTINIIKDIAWAGYWIYILPRERENFLMVTFVFLLSSFLIYYKVIRHLNRL